MHEQISDEELMLLYRGGDDSAFATLYNRYRSPLFRYFRHQCGNTAIAEELYQDIWLNLIRVRARYTVTASFRTFIYRMAHNRLIDHYRRQKHGVPVSYDEHTAEFDLTYTADPVSVERQLNAERQLAALQSAIGALPEAQREAFLLKENGDLSVEQIAEVTGTNPETAKSRIRYAVNKLRQALELDEHD